MQILPSARNSWDLIGESIGQNISQNLPNAIQQGYQRQLGLKAIDQLQNDLSNSGGDYNKMLSSLMRAYTLNPGLERSGLGGKMLEMIQAKKGQDIMRPGEEPSQMVARSLPGFLEQPGQQPTQTKPEFFPTNIGPQEAPGNLPQAATTGQVLPLLTPGDQIKEAKKLAKQSTDSGIPMTVSEALNVVKSNELDKKSHNQDVEKERQARVEAQKDYGGKAEKALVGVYPDATPEQKAIFRKYGEEQAGQGKSEADIDRSLAKKAAQFKNTLVNVEKDIAAPRLQNLIQRSVSGTYKTFEEAGADVRAHLQPILDMGLYDSARKLLQDNGYGPEEREMIINPLSERSKTALNRIPEVKKSKTLSKVSGAPSLGLTFEKGPVNPDNIKSGLIDLKQSDPNFSLLLARKSFEDKGYDWRAFKNALNELEKEGFKLTDDQEIQRGYLDTPPLNKLEQILHGLNLIGR